MPNLFTEVVCLFKTPRLTVPDNVRDVADETYERYRREMREEYPEAGPREIRYFATLLTNANLADRSEFRHRYPVTLDAWKGQSVA